MTKNVLVTGGSGFIGSALIRKFIETTDYNIINIDKLTYASTEQSLASIKKSDRYNFECLDINDKSSLKEVFFKYKPSNVFHLAAESHVDLSIEEPSKFINTNILGTYNLLEISLKYWDELGSKDKKHFLFQHISTDEVYGSLTAEEEPFLERNPYNPSSPYSASKASADHLVRSWNKTYNFPSIISNCSNNFGQFQFPEKLIPLTIIKILNDEKIPIYGKGDQIRDWLFVDDHIDALIKIMHEGNISETYNIGANNEYTNLDLVTMICEIIDKLYKKKNSKKLITFVADRPAHDIRYAINSSKIRNELNWINHTDFKDSLVQTIKWYVENKNWWQDILKKNKKVIDRKGIYLRS